MNRKTFLLLTPLVAIWFLWRYRPKPSLAGQVALITGGSRGLGLELARKLGAEGMKLALVARNKEELHRAAHDLKTRGFDAATWACDVTDPAQVSETVQQVASHYGQINILINNAGQITVGPFNLFTPEDFEQGVAIHLMAPLHLTKAVLPIMKQTRGGRIVNIASIGGKVGVPHLSPYCASKFALVGLSKALRAELAGEGISVTTVCPGLMRTGSHWNARFKGQREKEFAWFAHGASLPGVSMSAPRAAGQIVTALAQRRAELIISLQANAMALSDAILPSFVATVSGLISRILPHSPKKGGHHSRTGWRVRSRWVPSFLTRLGENAALANNEVGDRKSPF